MTNGRGKSDHSIEPAKSPNNAEGPAAEAMEGRERAEGNSPERFLFPVRSSRLGASPPPDWCRLFGHGCNKRSATHPD
jgi:hypothetical protein